MTTIDSLDGASLAIQLAAIEEDHRSAQMDASKSLVKIETDEHLFSREQEREAEERAREKASDSSFWEDVSSIAKDVAVVGAVASAAFTGGSSLVVAAALVGGALTVGADVARRAGASSTLCTGMELAGAGLSLGAAGGAALFDVAPVVSETSATVSLVGKSVSTGATLVDADASYRQGSAESDATGFRADASDAAASAEDAQTRVDESIAAMRQALQDNRLKMGVVANLQRIDEQATQTLLNNMRG